MNQKLEIIVCYVGFGDCIHITLPDGCQLLIDTGRIKNFNNIKSFLENRKKKVDYILITHNHSDHINALPKFSEHFSLWKHRDGSNRGQSEVLRGKRHN